MNTDGHGFFHCIRLRSELRRDEGVKTEGNEGNKDGTVAGQRRGRDIVVEM